VIGGMLAASAIAIFIIPVSFEVVEKVSQWGNKKSPESPSQTASHMEGRNQ